MEFVASLRNPESKKFAFGRDFGIPPLSVSDDYGLSPDGRSGCRVPRVSVSIHCYEPHLETARHCSTSGLSVTECLPPGTIESTVLIRPVLMSLGQSRETYPVGSPDDVVITAKSLRSELEKFANFDSIIAAVSLTMDGDEIASWPYLTLEDQRAKC